MVEVSSERLEAPRQMVSTDVRRARRWTAIFFLVDGLGFGIWAGHIPSLQSKFDLTPQRLSFVLFGLVIGAMISMPLMGRAVSRYGSTKLVPRATFAYTAMLAAIGLAPSFLLLVLAALLFGAAKGSLDVSANSQAVAVEKQWPTLIMSSFQGCWSLGGLLGAGLSSITLHFGLVPSQTLTAAAFLFALLSLFGQHHLLRDEPHVTRQANRFQLPTPYLLGLSLIVMLGMFGEGAMADWSAVFLKHDIGVSASVAAIGYALYSSAMASGRFAGDRIAAFWSSKRLVQASGLLLASGLAIALSSHSVAVIMTGFMLAGFGLSNIVPIVFSAAGRDQTMGAGPAIAAVTTIGYFGFLAGPPIVGFISAYFNLRVGLSLLVLFGMAIAMMGRLTATETSKDGSR